MSIRCMVAVWESSCEDPQTLLLLLALADWCNDQGECWPSVPTLAKKSRQSERNCRLHLRRLEGLGVLGRLPGGGRNHTNSYFLNLQSLQSLQPLLPPLQGLRVVNPATIVAPYPSEERSPSVNQESLPEILSGMADPRLPEDGAPYTPWDATLEIPPVKPTRKAITPLPPEDWVRAQLLTYRTDFDFDALNDDEWWANTGNSFPEFHERWVAMAFASLARWLQDNPKRRPRTTRGWKQRMNFSLNWYYDKHLRRTTHGGHPTR